MLELQQILLTHARKYPLMEPTDAVKLVYQNAFGGGHLIRDEAACLQYLQQEYSLIKQERDVPLTEDIGNGLVRVMLNALDGYGYSLGALGRCFIQSASAHQCSLDGFQKKLELLRKLAQEGIFQFSATELEEYLSTYADAGYPMVSHSTAYRETYHPAYRVVRKSVFNADLMV